MGDQQIQTLIRKLRRAGHSTYSEAAYVFVLEALDFTMFRLERNLLEGEARHVSVDELLDGIREYAKEEFGPLAPYVFRSWGITNTEDFGRMVFELCDVGLLNRRDEDQLQDFRDGFDFQDAFEEIGSIRF